MEQLTGGRLHRALSNVVLTGAVLSVVIPLLWIIRLSLKPQEAYIGDPSGLGGGFTLENFVVIWDSGFAGFLLNSAIVVLVGVAVATVLATMAGYATAIFHFRESKLVLPFIASAIITPPAALAIPIFEQGLSFGFVNSRIGVGLVYGSLFSAWGTFFMHSYFRGIPEQLLESAKVDGATTLQTFLRIAVPLARPAMTTVVLINLFLQWSELILALVLLPGSENQTATVAVAQFSSQFRTGGPLTAAGMIVAVAPIVAVFAVSQKSLRAGVLAGGVKA